MTNFEEDWAHRRVIELIAEHRGVDAATISPKDRFQDYADFDSLDMVELIMALQDDLNIKIPAKLVTVQDLIDEIRASLGSESD